MFLVKILVVINTIYSVTLCCQSKVKPISKEKVIECIFENVTNNKLIAKRLENVNTSVAEQVMNGYKRDNFL